MSANRLKDSCRFLRSASLRDRFGNEVKEFAPFGERLNGDFRETTGKERVEAGRLEAARTGTLRVRNCAFSRGITPSDRVVIRGDEWGVISNIAVGNSRDLREMLLETGGAI